MMTELVQNWSSEEETTLMANACWLLPIDGRVKVNARQLHNNNHSNEWIPLEITLLLRSRHWWALPYDNAALPSLSLGPLIAEYDGRPDIAIRLLAQSTDAGKWHVRPRDQGRLARHRGEGLFPHRCRRSVVDVKD